MAIPATTITMSMREADRLKTIQAVPSYDSGLVVMFKPVQPEQLAKRLRELCAAPAGAGVPPCDSARLSR